MDAVSSIATEAASGVAEAVSGSETASEPMFTAPAGDADDLKTINGIGPVAEQQLNEQGITPFAQIAALTDAEIEKIDANMPFSAAQISDWKAQAAAK